MLQGETARICGGCVQTFASQLEREGAENGSVNAPQDATPLHGPTTPDPVSDYLETAGLSALFSHIAHSVPSDNELLERVQLGEHDAFDSLVERYIALAALLTLRAHASRGEEPTISDFENSNRILLDVLRSAVAAGSVEGVPGDLAKQLLRT